MSIRGVVPILPTAFHPDERVDFDRVPALVEFAIQAGAAAIGLPAFGSEFYKLDGGERKEIIARAIAAAGKRIPVIVQCNHTSAQVAAAMAKEAEAMGADAINTAIPRAFPASEGELLAHARRICESVSIPVILQDWNPGGPTIGLEFVTGLAAQCENFSAVKYEEPGIGPLIRAIAQATSGRVGTYTGWGGSFMMELIPAGSLGIMPGLPLVDYFNKIWDDLVNDRLSEAHRWFARIAPYIAFSLQNLEQFHHVEKALLVRRGLLAEPVVRSVTVCLNADAQRYLELLLDETCAAIEAAGLSLTPS